MDEDRHRISLGMKNSYFMGNHYTQSDSKQNSMDVFDKYDHILGTQLTILAESGLSGIQNFDIEAENAEIPILANVEARASVPPLQVSLDDIERSGMNDVSCQNKENIDHSDATDEKRKRKEKKKAKEERWFVIYSFSLLFPRQVVV